MRAQPDTIQAPPFPRELPWVNVAPLRMDKQIGRPVLIEFWDFCRVNSLRTLPYMSAWHERYADRGLRVIGIHTGGFEISRDEANIRRAVERLGVQYPVVIDARFELWDFYGNKGWPARYLWDPRGSLFSLHYGEGNYEETERAIQQLLAIDEETVRVEAGGVAEAADWDTLASPETYVGFARGQRCTRARADGLALNGWALDGASSVGEEEAALGTARGSIA